MEAHTKGPWAISSTGSIVSADGGYVAEAYDGKRSLDTDLGIAAANAALIAASPELYEALKTVLQYYEGKPPFDFHRLPMDQRENEAFDAWHPIADRIRSALSRATPQSEK